MILETCSHYLAADGSRHEIDQKANQQIKGAIEKYSSLCLRTLGFAYKIIDAGEFAALDNLDTEKVHEIEKNDLTLVCVAGVSFNDLKQETPGSIEVLKSAGVNISMLTGDHILNAK